MSVGGKLETRYNRPLDFTGEIVSRQESAVGKTVVLRHKGLHLIVSELPAAANKPDFFTDLGLDVWAADVVVVKNLFPFRFNFIAMNRGTLNVETPGTTSVDVFGLGYQKVPRPIYPLDPVESWRSSRPGPVAGLHEMTLILAMPGRVSKPVSKLRMRSTPWRSMMATCSASRADSAREPARTVLARSTSAASMG